MSADLLRQAAAKIRETAGAAQRELDELLPEDPPDLSPWNATEHHYALWSPDVAHIVADVLEERARWYSAVVEGQVRVGGSPEFASSEGERQVADSLSLARLILKEES